MPVVAIFLSTAILLWVGLHPAQVLFHAAQYRITAKNTPAINSVLVRKQGMHKSTRMMQHGSSPDDATEAIESKVTGLAISSFDRVQWIRLDTGISFINPL